MTSAGRVAQLHSTGKRRTGLASAVAAVCIRYASHRVFFFRGGFVRARASSMCNRGPCIGADSCSHRSSFFSGILISAQWKAVFERLYVISALIAPRSSARINRIGHFIGARRTAENCKWRSQNGARVPTADRRTD